MDIQINMARLEGASKKVDPKTQCACEVPSTKHPHIAFVDTTFNTWSLQSQKSHPGTWESP